MHRCANILYLVLIKVINVMKKCSSLPVSLDLLAYSVCSRETERSRYAA